MATNDFDNATATASSALGTKETILCHLALGFLNAYRRSLNWTDSFGDEFNRAEKKATRACCGITDAQAEKIPGPTSRGLKVWSQSQLNCQSHKVGGGEKTRLDRVTSVLRGRSSMLYPATDLVCLPYRLSRCGDLAQ